MKLHEVMKDKLKAGDYIICKGNKVKIAEVLQQDFYFCEHSPERSYIDIEFTDSKGKYRHWKSNLDGGTIKYSKDISTIMTCSTLIETITTINSPDLKDLIKEELYSGCNMFEISVKISNQYDSVTALTICRSLQIKIIDYLQKWIECLLKDQGMTVGEARTFLFKKDYPEDLVCQSLVEYLKKQILV